MFTFSKKLTRFYPKYFTVATKYDAKQNRIGTVPVKSSLKYTYDH